MFSKPKFVAEKPVEGRFLHYAEVPLSSEELTEVSDSNAMVSKAEFSGDVSSPVARTLSLYEQQQAELDRATDLFLGLI